MARRTLILAIAVMLAAAVKTAAQALPVQSQSPAKTIDVVGRGEASAKPDTMIVSFIAESEAPNADQCTRLHADRTRKIVDALKAKLSSEAGIETSQFSLTPQYIYRPPPVPQPEAAQSLWNCKIDVTAYAPTIDQLGGLVDAGMAAGATGLAGSGFDYIPQEQDAGPVLLGAGRFTGGALAGQPKRMPAVTLDIESQGSTAAEATRRSAEIAGKVEQAFKQKLQGKGMVRVLQFGITRSIQSGQPRPMVIPRPAKPRPTSWQAHTTITARTHDLGALGALIEAGMKAGATRLQQVTFTLSNDSAASRQAIEKASEDAKSKAATLARSMGVKLGSVMRISTSASAQPQVVYGEALQHASFAAAPSVESMPVMPREIGYVATVNVTYQIE